MSLFMKLTIRKRFLLTSFFIVTLSVAITSSLLIYNEFKLLNNLYSDLSDLSSNLNSQLKTHLKKAETKQVESANKALDLKAKSLMNFTAEIAPTAMRSADYMLLDEYLAQLCTDPDIVFSYVANRRGDVISTYTNQNDPFIRKLIEKYKVYSVLNLGKILSNHALVKTFSKDIIINKRKAGSIVIMVSIENLNKQLGTLNSDYLILREGTKMTFSGLQSRLKNQIREASYKSLKLGIVSCLIAILASLFLTYFTVKGIVFAIGRYMKKLLDNTGEVAEVSDRILDASSTLSEDALTQAASLEESSASLEEMAAMTRKNAENAEKANSLMREANHTVKVANLSFKELINSMEEINSASSETSKIIKTIDEIAFQTNLLALNAAVEAARAGEAGAGFAVVADEVRNLANRAAEAAKNSELLILDTVTKIETGVDAVEQSTKAFEKVSGSTEKIGQLLDNISEASKDQAEGINQINSSIAILDQKVQQNAHNAGNTSKFAGKMKDLSGEMETSVNSLMQFSGIKTEKKKDKKGKELQLSNSEEVSPEEILPLD